MSQFDVDLGWLTKPIEVGKPSRLDKIISMLKTLYPEAEMSPTIGGGEADRFLSIDLKVTFPDRVEVWALKFRRKKWYKTYDVTIEILNGDGTLGDWYRFAGGVVKKYVYGWFDNGNIVELLVLDIAELMKIPADLFDGPLRREFPGGLKIKCFQNRKHGRAFFTVIHADFEHFPKVIEKQWKC